MEVVRWYGAKRFALILGLIGSCMMAVAQQGYSIQAGAYPTALEAEQARGRLALECWPIDAQFIPDGSGFPYKVRVGHFVTYAEAWANKSLLDSPELADAFIVPDGEERLPDQNVLPTREQFDSSGLDLPDPADGPAYWEAAGLAGAAFQAGAQESADQLESLLLEEKLLESRNRVRLRLARRHARAGNTTRVETLLREVRNSGSAPERAMADFVAAHADLHRKDREGALGRFARLVNNRSLPPSVRRESLRRAAGIFHSLQRYPEAWRTFELLEENARTPVERQEARMQLAGLAFELVKRGKGNWDEVRALCQVVSDDPETPRHVRATAELMKQETLWEEGRIAEALQGMEEYLARYGDIPREGQAARLWKGIFLLKLQRFDEAREVFEAVFAAGRMHGAKEKFAGVEPRELSAAWLAFIADRQGNLSARESWMQVLRSEFPDSPETRGLPDLFTK